LILSSLADWKMRKNLPQAIDRKNSFHTIIEQGATMTDAKGDKIDIDTPEPAPLTQFQMNQFVMLSALPTLAPALAPAESRLRWLEAEVAALKADVVHRAETVGSLLHRISLIREAAGCEGVMLAELPSKIATLRAELAKSNAERGEARRKNEAIEAMGYEWRWTLTLDADGNQIGVWFMRDEVEREEANDPLAEMWRELQSYQEQADRDGHGESWRTMCRERTTLAAWAAASAAEAAAAEAAWDAARGAGYAARDAAFSAQHADIAIDVIRRAKEAKR
jgi:hypothetical protein